MDVGGLWGTKNEMVTPASKAGAATVTMIDVIPRESVWWERFEQRCSAQNVSDVELKVGDITDRESITHLGSFDVVHCSGVMYHVPDIFGFVGNLLSITNEYLLVGSQTVPSVLSNSAGSIMFSNSGALCAPCLTESDRRVFQQHYMDAGRNIPTFDPGTKFINGIQADTGPWWWLFTPEFMTKVFRTFDLEILWSHLSRDETVFHVLVKKNWVD